MSRFPYFGNTAYFSAVCLHFSFNLFPFPFLLQKKKPDTSSATVITGSGGNGGAARLTSIQTTGGHARGGQKGRLAENNMAAAGNSNGGDEFQEMNDIQVRVVKDSNNEGNSSRNIPKKATEATIEVESSPASRAEALLTDAANAEKGANSQPVAQVTKALVNDHHVNNTESNGAAASTPAAASTSGVATSAGGASDGIEEVPQVKISNL